VINSRFSCKEVNTVVKKFHKNKNKIDATMEKITTTTLTSIGKTPYILQRFVEEQEGVLASKSEQFKELFNTIKDKLMKTYNLFIYKKEDIQKEWLSFVKTQDKALDKALRQAVKNTLMDLQKRFKSDTSDMQPIFRLFTVLEDKEQWAVVHEPSHDDLTREINAFMGKIIAVTAVIPQIERVFREERADKIALIRKEEEDAEKAGAGGANRFAKGGMRNPAMMSSAQTDQEKDSEWRRRWELPKAYEPKKDYHLRINEHKSIRPIKDTIKECILNVKEGIQNDAKRWSTQEQYRHLYNMRSERGRKRILQRKGDDQYGQDPVEQYRTQIELMNEQRTEIRGGETSQQEQFLLLDFSKLLKDLGSFALDFTQTIFSHILKESREELDALLNEYKTTIQELKTPAGDQIDLKRNKDKMEEVQQKLLILDNRRDPIKKKFEFLISEQDNDNERGQGNTVSIDITDEDKEKLASLDEAWEAFKIGLEDANVIIKKSFATLKSEMNNTLDDYKKEVIEKRKEFTNQAPYSVDKVPEGNNQKARDKLVEFKQASKELRDKEEENKFG
jgi:hypothetical protein